MSSNLLTWDLFPFLCYLIAFRNIFVIFNIQAFFYLDKLIPKFLHCPHPFSFFSSGCPKTYCSPGWPLIHGNLSGSDSRVLRVPQVEPPGPLVRWLTHIAGRFVQVGNIFQYFYIFNLSFPNSMYYFVISSFCVYVIKHLNLFLTLVLQYQLF